MSTLPQASRAQPHGGGPSADTPKTLTEVFRRFLRHTSPRLLLTVTPIAVGARWMWAPLSAWDLAVVIAVFASWPALEWLVHVFVLHFRPIQLGDRSWDPKVAAKHRAHHRAPWCAELIFIPLHTFTFTLPALLLLWFSVLPAPLACTGLATTLVGALHYEWVHHLVHTRYVPKSRPYRAMWRQHRLHHMKNEKYWFGVTTRAADLALRTSGAPDLVPTSATARSVHEGPLEPLPMK